MARKITAWEQRAAAAAAEAAVAEAAAAVETPQEETPPETEARRHRSPVEDSAGAAPAPVSAGTAPAPRRPRGNAARGEWVAYAEALGLDVDSEATRSEIILLVNSVD